MLVAERKDEASRGLAVAWQSDYRRSLNAGLIAGFQWFVSTSGLAEAPQFVIHVSSASPYTDALAQLEDLTAIQRGWDGHDAAAVAEGAIGRAREFLQYLNVFYRGAVPSPMVGPLSDGGVALVWRISDREVEINFLDRGESIEYAVTDRDGRRPTQFQERVGIDFLLSVVVPQQLLG